jgi:hypothetical protein
MQLSACKASSYTVRAATGGVDSLSGDDLSPAFTLTPTSQHHVRALICDNSTRTSMPMRTTMLVLVRTSSLKALHEPIFKNRPRRL